MFFSTFPLTGQPYLVTGKLSLECWVFTLPSAKERRTNFGAQKRAGDARGARALTLLKKRDVLPLLVQLALQLALLLLLLMPVLVQVLPLLLVPLQRLR